MLAFQFFLAAISLHLTLLDCKISLIHSNWTEGDQRRAKAMTQVKEPGGHGKVEMYVAVFPTQLLE